MRIVLPTLLVLILAGAVFAIESPSVLTGKALFESRHLGTSGKSCSSCHPDGRGLANTYTMTTDVLTELINRCIKGPLNGQALDPAATEMESLILYLQSLAAPAQ